MNKPRCLRPKRLGEKIKVVDPTSPYYLQECYKQMSRADGAILAYFPVTTKTGHLRELQWEQCTRI